MEQHIKIAIITTGGTISSLSSSNGIKPAEGVINRILREQLGYSSELISKDHKIKIEIVPLLNKDSTNINAEDQLKIAEKAFNLFKSKDAIIVTHGTDTLSFTSSMLAISLSYLKKPLIITGSMKTIEQENTDAIKNLSDAITFAKAGIGGVFVVFHGKVIPGQWAYETENQGNMTFSSIKEEIAHIQNNEIKYITPINNQFILLKPFIETRYDSNIGTIVLSPNENTEQLVALAEKNKAIILLSYGSVGIPSNYTQIISDISKVIPVILSSQIPSVHINKGEYEINKMADDAGVIHGIGLYSFDYNNTANVLGIIQSSDKREAYLRKFMQAFENNKNRMLNLEYHRTTINGTASSTIKHGNSDINSFPERSAFMESTLIPIKRSMDLFTTNNRKNSRSKTRVQNT